MPLEIIDLTRSSPRPLPLPPPPPPPPPPPMLPSSPRILNFAAAAAAGNSTVEQAQFENLSTPLWPNNNNPNQNHQNNYLPYYYTNIINHQSPPQHQAATNFWSASSMHVYDPSYQAAAAAAATSSRSFQPISSNNNTHEAAAVPDQANAFPSHAHDKRLREHWTLRDQELFMMGLIKYGTGHWTKIARHFLTNKTPQQVQSYANSFFNHLSSTNFYNLIRRSNLAYSNGSFMNNNDASPSYNNNNNNIMPNLVTSNYGDVEPIMKTLMLFPEKKGPNFFQIKSMGTNANASGNTDYGNEFQMETNGARAPMNEVRSNVRDLCLVGSREAGGSAGASGNYEEVDLELRLGRS